jgi:hypothetical protein
MALAIKGDVPRTLLLLNNCGVLNAAFAAT